MVGINSYKPDMITLIFDCKHSGLSRDETVLRCKDLFPRKDWAVPKINYILSKYKDDPRYQRKRDDNPPQPWDPASHHRAYLQSKTTAPVPSKKSAPARRTKAVLNQSQSELASPPIRKAVQSRNRKKLSTISVSPVAPNLRLGRNKYAEAMRIESGGPMKATFTSPQPINALNSPVHSERAVLTGALKWNRAGREVGEQDIPGCQSTPSTKFLSSSVALQQDCQTFGLTGLKTDNRAQSESIREVINASPPCHSQIENTAMKDTSVTDRPTSGNLDLQNPKSTHNQHLGAFMAFNRPTRQGLPTTKGTATPRSEFHIQSELSNTQSILNTSLNEVNWNRLVNDMQFQAGLDSMNDNSPMVDEQNPIGTSYSTQNYNDALNTTPLPLSFSGNFQSPAFSDHISGGLTQQNFNPLRFTGPVNYTAASNFQSPTYPGNFGSTYNTNSFFDEWEEFMKIDQPLVNVASEVSWSPNIQRSTKADQIVENTTSDSILNISAPGNPSLAALPYFSPRSSVCHKTDACNIPDFAGQQNKREKHIQNQGAHVIPNPQFTAEIYATSNADLFSASNGVDTNPDGSEFATATNEMLAADDKTFAISFNPTMVNTLLPVTHKLPPSFDPSLKSYEPYSQRAKSIMSMSGSHDPALSSQQLENQVSSFMQFNNHSPSNHSRHGVYENHQHVASANNNFNDEKRHLANHNTSTAVREVDLASSNVQNNATTNSLSSDLLSVQLKPNILEHNSTSDLSRNTSTEPASRSKLRRRWLAQLDLSTVPNPAFDIARNNTNTAIKQVDYQLYPEDSSLLSGEPPDDWFYAALESSASSETALQQSLFDDFVDMDVFDAMTYSGLEMNEIYNVNYINGSEAHMEQADVGLFVISASSKACSSSLTPRRTSPTFITHTPPFTQSGFQYADNLRKHQFAQLKSTVADVGPCTINNRFFIAEAAVKGIKEGRNPPVPPGIMILFGQDFVRDNNNNPINYEREKAGRANGVEDMDVDEVMDKGDIDLLPAGEDEDIIRFRENLKRNDGKRTCKVVDGKLMYAEHETRMINGRLEEVEVLRVTPFL